MNKTEKDGLKSTFSTGKKEETAYSFNNSESII